MFGYDIACIWILRDGGFQNLGLEVSVVRIIVVGGIQAKPDTRIWTC